MDAAALENRLGHRFARPALLEEALTHSSFSADNNERLEFIGDAVLDCATGELLFHRFPQLSEGRLTQFRSALVRRDTLARVAEAIDLTTHLRVGTNLLISPAVLADAFEAVIGAVFIDAGYEAVRKIVAALFAELLDRFDPDSVVKDAKSRLQELLHASGKKEPEYRLLRTLGPENNRRFQVSCSIPELQLETKGAGTSLQRAQQEAAQAMLDKLST